MELTEKELEKISEIAVSAAQDFIFSKITKKEVVDIDINVELHHDDVLDFDISVDLVLDDLSAADAGIVDGAADYAVEMVERFLARI